METPNSRRNCNGRKSENHFGRIRLFQTKLFEEFFFSQWTTVASSCIFSPKPLRNHIENLWLLIVTFHESAYSFGSLFVAWSLKNYLIKYFWTEFQSHIITIWANYIFQILTTAYKYSTILCRLYKWIQAIAIKVNMLYHFFYNYIFRACQW